MIRSITLVNTTTCRTDARCIARIDRHYEDAIAFSFVLNLSSQIVEGPRGMLSPLSLPNLYPVSDARKVFQSNTATGALGFLNNPLADAMIGVFSEARFLAASLFQKAFCRFCTFALQLRTETGMAMAQAIHLSATENLTIRISRDVFHAEVDSKKIIYVLGRGGFNFNRTKQVELPFNQDQVRFATFGLKQFKLSWSSKEGDTLSAGECPDRDYMFVDIPRQDTRIECNTTSRIEDVLAFTFSFTFVRGGNFGDCSYYNLSSKGETCFDIKVNTFLQAILTKDSLVPRYFADIVTGSINSFKRFKQRLILFRRRLKFDLCDKFHGSIISYFQLVYKLKGGGAFLPRLKPWASCAGLS